ncbi:conjugative transposon protein TraM, partial [Tamlana sp. 2_MG-2023]|uniref:conjugative transposon protein TraM n=1 Tax=Tamlana sp. 2_MG-2023 TaxID=3062683 RepID=UPI0026E2A4AA
PKLEINQIPIPELEGDQKQYESKLEAINDLKEVKQTNAPSIYDERYLDSLGIYDTELLDNQKIKLVDSIYKNSKIYYTNTPHVKQEGVGVVSKVGVPKERDSIVGEVEEIDTKAFNLEHLLFFASSPIGVAAHAKDQYISVIIDGTQTVRTNHRINMRLLEDTEIEGKLFLKHTPIYGFVDFEPNRTIITIDNIQHHPVKLKAYDLQDGREGIYVRNSFRGEATTEVIGDIVQDVNIAGVPQVNGIKKIFQQNNRSIKVKILGNYKLYLRAD